jgi:hypothetical protein
MNNNLQNPKRQHKDHSILHLRSHAYRPNHRDRHQSIKPITDDSHDRERVRSAYERIAGDASWIIYSNIPLSFHGRALEKVVEEYRSRPYSDDDHASLESVYISSLDGNPKEEYGDAEFYEHHVDYVCEGCKCLKLTMKVSMLRISRGGESYF